ncbi:PHP domain-containing protein [Saccharomonospora cyanea]|uniref:Putative metal-dependent phosphoesterase, PHP family n=1 Tax=Saccharomonospora cyanea NA-134 TaxID=882082 RepID=H5XJE8_9PSEU|nr:PHP domain-containing protein [Saccharomonospora cyanea]EHR59698.1 putative metal-dependent phosphoesterase, PHP family [Saccharomonospora cyanea NA-134]
MVGVRIDLHTHSTVSDGTDSPDGLVRVAADAGLDVVALTDHDTTAGWEAAARALPRGLRLVPGAELSCESVAVDGRRVSVHLLAYLFDPEAPALVAEQRRLRLERRTRLRVMAERMAADGLPIDPDEVLGGLPPDAPAGRPHLARALMRAGVVQTVDEAFARFLGGGRGYYVPRTDTPVETAIDMIEDAGGVTVLAHPFATSRGPTVSEDTIAALTERGLTGVEVDHPDHDAATRRRLRALADDLGLVRTGSSDYHGTNKTIAIGQETTDPDQFEALLARAGGTPVTAS